MMNFELKTRKFVVKTRNCASKTRNFALKMMNSAALPAGLRGRGSAAGRNGQAIGSMRSPLLGSASSDGGLLADGARSCLC